MCLQHALSGYFQTNFGNFWSHFRAEFFWDIDQRANSHRKTNGSLRLKKFRTVYWELLFSYLESILKLKSSFWKIFYTKRHQFVRERCRFQLFFIFTFFDHSHIIFFCRVARRRAKDLGLILFHRLGKLVRWLGKPWTSDAVAVHFPTFLLLWWKNTAFKHKVILCIG